MNHRHLGQSGLVVSEISYGNWITHGSQIEKDAAIACVRAALQEGVTTFDTADIYANTKADEVLREAFASALFGQRIISNIRTSSPPGSVLICRKSIVGTLRVP
jgi:aryl-alcohol dehydrogenase-like predicted oxidoreductase